MKPGKMTVQEKDRAESDAERRGAVGVGGD